MKTKALILVLVAAFIVPFNAQAQLGSKLKKRLEEAVSKTAGKDTTGQAENTEQEDSGRQLNLPNLGIGRVTAAYDNNYDFRGLIKMRTEVYNKGKQEAVMDIDTWLNADLGNLGMEGSNIATGEGQAANFVAVVDMKNRVMITITDLNGSKTGIIMPIPDSLEAGNSGTPPEENIKITKKGGTRTICGYRCEEYEITEEEGKLVSNVWVTDELKIKGDRKLLGNQQGMPRNYGLAGLNGSMMASETYDKGVLTSKTEVTEVDLNATHSISLEGVSLMQMDMSKWMKRKNK
jgi:hypothetical protein